MQKCWLGSAIFFVTVLFYPVLKLEGGVKDCGRVGGAYFSSPGDTVTKDTVSQAFIHTKQSLYRTISNFFS